MPIMETNAPSEDVSGKPNGAGRRYSTVLLVITGALLLFAFISMFSGSGGRAGSLDIAQPADGAREARVHLELGVTDLRLDTAASKGLLIAGEATRGRWERLTESFTVNRGVADYRLASRRLGVGQIWTGQRTPWNLHLNPDLPTDLRIDAGVGALDLQLRDAALTRLNLELGVGATTLTLPETGPLQVTVDAGVGSSTLRVPGNAPVRLVVDSGLGRVTVSDAFRREGNAYVSASWKAGMKNAIDVSVDGGVGAIDVEAY